MKDKLEWFHRQYERLNKVALFNAVLIWSFSLIINMLPIVFDYLEYKSCGDLIFAHWLFKNHTYYYAILVIAFTSFVEYIISQKSLKNIIIWLDLIYIILTNAWWSLVYFRCDLLERLLYEDDRTILPIVFFAFGIVISVVNLFAMNYNVDN